MLDLEQLEFTLESKWTGRCQKTPLLSVGHKNANLNVATVKLLDISESLWYQIAETGGKYYLIVGNFEFANQSYKCHLNTDPKTQRVMGIGLTAKDVFTKFGPQNGGTDKVRYDLIQVPIKGNVFAFEMVKVFSDSITTVEHQ